MQKIKRLVRDNPHVWWSLFLPAYLMVFFTLEHFIRGQYWATQLPLDGKIPFVEWFVIFYSSWAPLLVALGVYLMIRDGEGFRRYIWTLMITFFASSLICVLIPNGQDLRPQVMPRDNFFCRWVWGIYAVDTNTNVFPSVHVVGVLSALFAFWRAPGLQGRLYRAAAVVWGVLIILSTLLIRQHALLDVAASFALSAIAYWIVYVLIARRRDLREM